MTLHGARAPIEAVRQWMKTPSRHLILWGDTGVGKTTILTTIGEQEGMQAETHEDPLVAIENARHPTFLERPSYLRTLIGSTVVCGLKLKRALDALLRLLLPYPCSQSHTRYEKLHYC